MQVESTYIFENELFPSTVVQQGQRVDAVGCRRFFRAVTKFVFRILQIRSGYIQISAGPSGRAV